MVFVVLCFKYVASQSFCALPILGELEGKRQRKEANFPAVDELLTWLAGGVNYQWLCQKLLPFVVGFKKWNKSYMKKEPLLDVAT